MNARTTRDTRRMSVGARVATGIALTLGVGALVTAGTIAPWPSITHDAPTLIAEPAGAAASATCTGPLLAAGRNSQAAGELAVAATATAVGEGELTTLPAAVGGEAPVFVGPAGGGAAGAQTSSVVTVDLVGFAASVCPVPSFQHWLAVGATTTGAADLVLITNPGDVAATVDISVFGSTTPVSSPGGTGIVLAPRSQQVIPLAGLIIGERDPIVRVSATGAPVVAAMQTSFTQTLEPVGLDVVAGAAASAPVQVIPGVVVPAVTAAGSAPIKVRVLAPDADATATVTATPVGSTAPAASATIALTAGTTVEAGLTNLAPGTYVVRVTSAPPVVDPAVDAAAPDAPEAAPTPTPEAPIAPTPTPSTDPNAPPVDPNAPVAIVASAMTSSAAPRDIGWFVAAPAIAAETPVVSGPGAQTRLIIAAGDADAVVEITDPSGAATEQREITAGGSIELDVAAGEVWRLASDVPVHASIAYSGTGILAGTPVQAPADQAPPIRIYP